MPLTNYTFVFNGLTIGTGTSFLVTNVEGLGGTSPLRIQDDNRGYIDGSYSGRDFYDERTVYIDVTVLGDNSNTAQANYKLLQEAYAPQPLCYYVDPTGYTASAKQLKLFQFRLNGNTGDMQMYGRSRGLSTPIDADFAYGYIKTRIQMTFPDPRYYTDVATTPTVSNLITFTNNGWATSCPVITINSPLASGLITDGEITMYFTGVTTSSPLVIDLLSRVIYVGGVATRNVMTAASNGWLSLEPDSITAWTSTIGNMSVPYRSAYI
jgi:hypothetical protein